MKTLDTIAINEIRQYFDRVAADAAASSSGVNMGHDRFSNLTRLCEDIAKLPRSDYEAAVCLLKSLIKSSTSSNDEERPKSPSITHKLIVSPSSAGSHGLQVPTI